MQHPSSNTEESIEPSLAVYLLIEIRPSSRISARVSRRAIPGADHAVGVKILMAPMITWKISFAPSSRPQKLRGPLAEHWSCWDACGDIPNSESRLRGAGAFPKLDERFFRREFFGVFFATLPKFGSQNKKRYPKIQLQLVLDRWKSSSGFNCLANVWDIHIFFPTRSQVRIPLLWCIEVLLTDKLKETWLLHQKA